MGWLNAAQFAEAVKSVVVQSALTAENHEIAVSHQHINGAVRDLRADRFIICND
jgi:hypothetical protein